MFKRYRLRDFDFLLAAMVVAISLIGCLAIGSAQATYQSRQIAGVLVGIVLMLIISFINYNLVLKLYWVMYIINVVLLFMVIFIGDDSGGAQRWLEIGGIRFQPSETAKILLILFFAQFIMVNKDRIKSFRMVISCIALTGIPLVLILLQPDLSTSIMLLLIFCVIMFAGGISYKLVAGILAVIIPVTVIVITLDIQTEPNFVNEHLITGYQRNRIMAFFYPDEYDNTYAYQQLNSVMAIGSGQLEGKGYRNNEITSVKNGNFISEPQTDFIFAVIGEEFGFRGTTIVIVLLIGIAIECTSVARKAKDTAGLIIASGTGGWVAFQTFINIGVATFMIPNTGITLPFVSYGLTSLLSLYISMGFVLNVRLQAGRQ